MKLKCLTMLLMPVLAVGALLTGCSGPAVFLDRSYDFGYIEKVAVIPLENLSQSQVAGRQATLILNTELLASETFSIVEPGETAKVLGEISAPTGQYNVEQIKEIGKRLEAQALIFGTVTETSTVRSGAVTVPTVTMDLRMVETETGATVWAASHTEGRLGIGASLFGVGGKSSSETMHDCIRVILKTLIK
jgi:curli biogenesis system outer membrane secretion channel CsgG